MCVYTFFSSCRASIHGSHPCGIGKVLKWGWCAVPHWLCSNTALSNSTELTARVSSAGKLKRRMAWALSLGLTLSCLVPSQHIQMRAHIVPFLVDTIPSTSLASDRGVPDDYFPTSWLHCNVNRRL